MKVVKCDYCKVIITNESYVELQAYSTINHNQIGKFDLCIKCYDILVEQFNKELY